MVHGSNFAARLENRRSICSAWTFNHLTDFGRFGRPRRKSAQSATQKPSPRSQFRRPELAANPHLAAASGSRRLEDMFPKLSSWFGSRRDALYIGEINEYLSQASNVTDLEQRIRVIEQQRHFS